ncbi:hypothetical protein [Nonomuraea sp. NPDC049129]|uniref:hypothetical protein n=2 Tax=unclassified Nonomuraea TaxID=2593643 RepID=UPI0033C52FA6
MAQRALPTHVNAAVTDPLPSLSTPTMITSAVVVVAALLAVLTVLVAKARHRTRLATAGYVEPIPSMSTPHHSTAEADEGDQWRRQLLEAIEAAAADRRENVLPDARYGQENPRPENSSPVLGSATDPQETAAWTPAFEPLNPPGPLESLFSSEPSNSVVNLPETSPFDPFAPAESDPDSEYHGRRRRSEHPATDEGADEETPPGDTGQSTP